jgi:hypothetical protein
MAIALVLLPCLVFGATLPEPMLTYPNDTIFGGTLRDTLWCPHDSGTVFYTTNGSSPNTVSPFVSSGFKWPFNFDSTVTLKAFTWWRTGAGEVLYSNTITVKYTKKLSPPINDQSSKSFADSLIIRLTRPESGVTIHFTLDGSTPDSTRTVYTVPIVIKETVTIKYLATKPKCIASDILSRTYEKVPVSVNGQRMASQESNSLNVVTSGKSHSNIILDFSLTQPEDVFITMSDFSGRPIATLVNKRYGKGIHELSWDTRDIPAGLYLLKMKTSTGNLVKRVSLVR